MAVSESRVVLLSQNRTFKYLRHNIIALDYSHKNIKQLLIRSVEFMAQLSIQIKSSDYIFGINMNKFFFLNTKNNLFNFSFSDCIMSPE